MQAQHPVLSAFADECSGSFEEQLEALKRNNIHYLELRGADGKQVHEQSLEDIRSYKQRAHDAGVEVSAVGSSLGKCPVDADMEEQRAICRHLVEVAHILETPYIRIFSFHTPKEQSPDDFRQQVTDNLGALIEEARGSGVFLALENEKGIFGDVAERCHYLHKTFHDTGLLKGVFDFANYMQMGQCPLNDCWPLLKDYTDYFHIKDVDRAENHVVPAGHGDGYLKEVLSDAVSNGFASYLSVEPHLWPRFFGGTSESRFDLAVTEFRKLLAEMNIEG